MPTEEPPISPPADPVFTDNFDGETTGQTPSNWTTVPGYGGAGGTCLVAAPGYGGAGKCMALAETTASVFGVETNTLAITAGAGQGLQVSFWAKASKNNVPLRIVVSGDYAAAPTWLHLKHAFINTSWEQHFFTLRTPAVGDADYDADRGTYRLRFDIIMDEGTATVWIDDVSVDRVVNYTGTQALNQNIIPNARFEMGLEGTVPSGFARLTTSWSEGGNCALFPADSNYANRGGGGNCTVPFVIQNPGELHSFICRVYTPTANRHVNIYIRNAIGQSIPKSESQDYQWPVSNDPLDWNQPNFTFTPSLPAAGEQTWFPNLFYVEFEKQDLASGDWDLKVDEIWVGRGSGQGTAPAPGQFVNIVTAKYANCFRDNETLAFDVNLASYGAGFTGSWRIKVTDHLGAVVSHDEGNITLVDGVVQTLSRTISVPATQRGVWHILATLRNGSVERVADYETTLVRVPNRTDFTFAATPFLGMHAPYIWHTDATIKDARWDLLVDVGVGWLRKFFLPNNTDLLANNPPGPDVVTQEAISPARGMKVLGVFGPDRRPGDSDPAVYAAYGNYAQSLAANHAIPVDYWELWNEPWLIFGSDEVVLGSSPPIPLWRAIAADVYASMEAGNPSATLISNVAQPGGSAAWDDAVLLTGYADAISIHQYPDPVNTPEFEIPDGGPQAISTIRSQLPAGLGNIPIWQTEGSIVATDSITGRALSHKRLVQGLRYVSWGSEDRYRVRDEDAMAYLEARRLILEKMMGVTYSFLFEMDGRYPGTLGMVNWVEDGWGRCKPLVPALAGMTRALDNTTFYRHYIDAANNVQVLIFYRGVVNEYLVTFWTRRPDDAATDFDLGKAGGSWVHRDCFWNTFTPTDGGTYWRYTRRSWPTYCFFTGTVTTLTAWLAANGYTLFDAHNGPHDPGGANQPPEIFAIQASPTVAIVGQNVQFSTYAADPEGLSLTYAWNFGDAGTSTAAAPTHAYAARGTYDVTLVVNDGVNPSATYHRKVRVGRRRKGGVLAGGLVSYWPLSRASRVGAAYGALTPNTGLNFTAYNTPTLSADQNGRANSALSFAAASSEYAAAADSPLLSFVDSGLDMPFSIAFWAKVTGSGSLYLGKGVGGTDGEYLIQIDPDGGIAFTLFDESVPASIGRTANELPPWGAWHHYAFTYDGGGAALGLKVYRDGARIDDTSIGSGVYVAMEAGSSALHLGRNAAAYSDATVADLRLYDVDLPESEVATLAKVYE